MSNTYYPLTKRGLPGLLSIVVPVFNEEEVVPLLVAQLIQLMDRAPCAVESLIVNDGSSDRSIEHLIHAAQRDPRFRIISLARNFGHQVAATAGLDAAAGDAIVLMDADLQDPPDLVLNLLDEYLKGYDVVYARRERREGETLFKKLSAWMFYRLMRLLVSKDLPVDVGDYRLVSRRFLNALNSMRETHRFLRGMVSWVGFPQTFVPFVRKARAAGETKYPLRKMLLFAWTAAISFSPIPLQASFYLGVLLLSIGTTYGVYALVRMVMGLYLVPGWTSLVILNCLSAGAVMIAIGVLGEYVAKIFEEVKGRPLYIISDHYNFDSTAKEAAAEIRQAAGLTQ